MGWPNHTPMGQIFSALHLQDEIILTCQTRLSDPSLPALSRIMYDLVLAHAQLDRVNHAHGLFRNFVLADGTGKGANANAKLNNLNAAWGNVQTAHALVMMPAPALGELQSALQGIDHGGGGGILPA